MLYKEINIGNETYKLRLNTRSSINMERALGYNPITMLMEMEKGKMPKLNDVMIIFHAMLQAYHHGTDLNRALDLFDEYCANGKSMFDLIPIFIEVFEMSGYITKSKKANDDVDDFGEEKN